MFKKSIFNKIKTTLQNKVNSIPANYTIANQINFVFLFITLIFIIALIISIFAVGKIPTGKNALISLYNSSKSVEDLGKSFSTEVNLHKSVLSSGKLSNSSSLYAEASNAFDNASSKLVNDPSKLSKDDIKLINDLKNINSQSSEIFFNNTLIIGKSITNGTANNIEIDQRRIDTLKNIESLNKDFTAKLSALNLSIYQNITYYNNLIDNQLNFIITVFILAILFALIFTVINSVFTTRFIVNNMKTLTSNINNVISNKDLTETVNINGKSEIAVLCSNFNKMIDWQKEIFSKIQESAIAVGAAITQINNNINELSLSSENQSNVTEEFTAALEEIDKSFQETTSNITGLAYNIDDVAKSIAQMSDSIQETSNNVGNTVEAINEISSSIGELDYSITVISNHSDEMLSDARNTVSKSREGNISVNNTSFEMDIIYNSVIDLSAVIGQLGDSVEQISEITNIIDDIAEQTNLLSLNAAIEAARAGEYGKGFSVVANSIRSLAERSSESTKDISRLIKGIQSQVKRAITLMNNSTSSVCKGVQTVKETGQVFQDICSAIDRTSTRVQEITSAINQQKDISREVVKSVEKINELINFLSSTTEEQAVSSDDVVESIKKINQLIKLISQTVKQQAQGSQEIVILIQGINQDSQSISQGNFEIAQSTESLEVQSQKLIKLLNQFKLN